MLALQPWDQLTRLTSYPLYEVVAELVLIWLAVFLVWRFVQGTRAAGAIRGLLVIVLITLAVRLVAPAEMFQRLAFLYDNFLGFAALALVIIFQPELRRAMIRLGETAMFRQTPSDVAPVIDALVSSCTFLSKNKFGAIMAIERQVGLRETIEGGSQLNADVSAELLNSIFWPNNPLHDMGVVIRGPKVVAAGVQFPLADPQEMTDPRLGTRHRAAVGLSRVGDAIVIVVSEENGAISLAERGQLQRWVTPESLREELRKRLATAPPPEPVDENERESGSRPAGATEEKAA